MTVSQVPLDYSHPSGPSGTVALLKVPSALDASDEAYRGPILFNPGVFLSLPRSDL
jgi:hypothetical protein